MPLGDPSSPTSLFYFSALNGEERRLWAQQILLEDKVYFRSREQLNDPRELRPSIVAEGTDKQMRKFARDIVTAHWPTKLSPARRFQEENKVIHRWRKTPHWVEATLHELLDQIGVFCLSENCTNELLWAHYADGHRGIAIEFDARVGLFLAAKRVIYTDQRPVINRLADDSTAIGEKGMLTKGAAWAYEREWRVIARWRDEVRARRYLEQHHVLADLESFVRDQHGPGHYSFPPEAIKSVILGSRIAPEAETWLQSVLSRAPRAIPTRRATLRRDGGVTVE